MISDHHSNDIPLVSVNLTTYKRAHMLPRALDSILNQSYSNLEIIIVDDCSPDNTLSVVEQYRRYDTRIKYYRHNLNLGNARSRNTALKKSHGEYIAFMDDDDEWIDVDKIAKQITVLSANPRIGLVCSSVRLYKSRASYRDKLISVPPSIKSAILSGNGIIYSPTVVIRYSLIDKVGGFDDMMAKGVDSEFFRRCIVKYGIEVHFMLDVTTAIYEHSSDRMTPVTHRHQAVKALRANMRVMRNYYNYYLLFPKALVSRLNKIAIEVYRVVRYR